MLVVKLPSFLKLPNYVPFFVLFLCFFSPLSPLDLFDPHYRFSRFFQIRFVYHNSYVYRTFRLLLSRCVLSILIFIAFQVCFVYFDLLSRSSYVLSIAMRIHICSVCHDLLSRYRYVSSIALDLLLRSSYVLSIAMRIHICSVCRDDLSQSRYVSSVALLKYSWCSWLIWSLRGIPDWFSIASDSFRRLPGCL